MVVSVGQACNFKCRDCGNFAPFSPKEFRRYQVDDIKENIKNILETVTYIHNIQIQGGEPFLYSDLNDLIEYLGDYKKRGKIHNITIATNGSIFPSQEMLSLIKMYDVEIRISDYNIAHESAERLRKECERNNIKNFYYRFANGQAGWYACGDISFPRENDDKIVNRRYKTCAFKGCLTLERGELSYCSRAANSFAIQKFERKPDDFLKIQDHKTLKKELRKFLLYRHKMEACRYCNGTDDRYLIEPAIQIGSLN